MSDPEPLLFQQTLFIAADASAVWAALVTPEIVAQYHLCPLKRIELTPGGRIEYAVGDEVMIGGQVMEVEAGRKLVHTFQFNPKSHDNVLANALSRVTYEITPMGAMCGLTLTHDEFGEDYQTHANVMGGWPSILSGLKTLLETGKPLPWPAD